MKRFLLLLLPSLLWAQTQSTTPNIQLYIPGYNQANWQVPLNYNFDLLDKYISTSVSLLPPPGTLPGLFLWVKDGANATDCTTGGGAYAVPCKSSGSAWVALSMGTGGSGGGITGLSGDVTAGPGTGVVAATVVKVNGSVVPPNLTCAGTNATGQFIAGTCTGGGGGTLPLTTLGDTLYENAVPAPARLAGNTSATVAFLTQTGTGTISAGPQWAINPSINNTLYTYPFGGTPYLAGNQFMDTALLGQDFNMQCDNATDDTTAIQNAINSISGGGSLGHPAELKLPATLSNCLISGVINLTGSNILIRGVAGATTIKVKDNSWLGSVFNITGSNVVFKDITVDGNIANGGVGWFISGWCGVAGGTDSYGVPAATPGSYCPTVASGAAVPVYDKCGAGDSEGGQGTSGCASGIIQGGPDVVGSKQGGTLYLYSARSHGSNLALPTGTGTNANWSYIYNTNAAAAVAAPQTGGILFAVNNASHFTLDHVEMKNSVFGVYVYANTADVVDIKLLNSWCHDFGVQYQGNNSDLDCLHGGPDAARTHSINKVTVDNGTFENLFIPITGPGNSSMMLMDASNVTVTNNHIINSLNRGGGAIVPGSYANSSWRMANNSISKTVNLNGSLSDGIEMEQSYSTVTGNSIFNLYSCITMTNLQVNSTTWANVGNNTLTGNQCYGDGTATSPSSGGIVLISSGNGQIYDTTATGNVIDNYGTGIWIGTQGTINPRNIIQTGNAFDGITSTNVLDPTDAQGNAWVNYTPTLTITSGDGVWSCTAGCVGHYKIIGKTVYMQMTLSGTYSGGAAAQNATITLPVDANAPTAYTQFIPIVMTGHGVATNPVSNSYINAGLLTFVFTVNATSGSNFFAVNGVYQLP